MKSKQLFLILFILVIIGIAMTVVITRSQAKAVEANRNALTRDLLYYAAKAREFYWRPITLGGGNRSFFGVTLPMLSNVSSNANGRYSIVGSPTKDEIVIKGIGTVTEGKDTAQVQIIINEQNNSSWIIR